MREQIDIVNDWKHGNLLLNLNFIIAIFELVHPQKMVLLNSLVILYFRRSVISAWYGFADGSKIGASHHRSNKQVSRDLHAFISMKSTISSVRPSTRGQRCFQLLSWFPSVSATSTIYISLLVRLCRPVFE